MLLSLPFTETYLCYRASPSPRPTYVTEPPLHCHLRTLQSLPFTETRTLQSLPFTQTYVRYRASPSPRPTYVTEPPLHQDLRTLQSLPFTDTYICYRASPSPRPTYVTEPPLHRDLRTLQSLPFTETYVRYWVSLADPRRPCWPAAAAWSPRSARWSASQTAAYKPPHHSHPPLWRPLISKINNATNYQQGNSSCQTLIFANGWQTA